MLDLIVQISKRQRVEKTVDDMGNRCFVTACQACDTQEMSLYLYPEEQKALCVLCGFYGNIYDWTTEILLKAVDE